MSKLPSYTFFRLSCVFLYNTQLRRFLEKTLDIGSFRVSFEAYPFHLKNCHIKRTKGNVLVILSEIINIIYDSNCTTYFPQNL